jgi:hypothetical protein
MKTETSPAREFPRWPAIARLGFAALYPFLVKLGLESGWPPLEHADLLLYLPVLFNLALLWVFASSLVRGVPLVETFARMWEADLSTEKIRYCRAVTKCWSGFFVVSGAVAWTLAQQGDLTWWSLYTGVIAHVCAALFGGAELLLRVRRFGPVSAGPLRRLFERSPSVDGARRDSNPLPLFPAKDPRDAA